MLKVALINPAQSAKYPQPPMGLALIAAAPEIDIIVRGEGEETIIDLLRALEFKQPLDKVPGISYRKNDKMVSTRASSRVHL